MKNSRLAALLVVFAALVGGLWFFLRATDGDIARESARAEAAKVAKSAAAATPLEAPVSESGATRERDSTAESLATARAEAEALEHLPCRFDGAVVDSQNLPARGGRWRLVALDGSNAEHAADLHPFDSDARFTFNSKPGSFDLIVTAPRRREQHVRVELTLDQPYMTRTIVLVGVDQVFVRLQAADGGRPFRNTAALEDGKSLSVVATKNEQSTKRASAIPTVERVDRAAWPRNSGWEEDPSMPIEWVLELDPLPHMFVSAVLGDTVIATRAVAAGDGFVTLVLGEDGAMNVLASLRLRVVEADGGRPIAGVDLRLGPASAVSDANGLIELAGLAPGKQDFVISAVGYEMLSGTLTLLTSDRVDFGDFVLTPVTSIEGRVLDVDGRPSDLRVDLIPLEDDSDLAAGRARHLRDLDLEHGVFRFRDVGRALYLLRLRDETLACDPLVVDTRNGSVSGLELRARPGSRVTFDYHAGERPVRFRLDVLEGKDKVHYHGHESGEAALTLAPGHYLVRIDRVDEANNGGAAHFERGLDVADVPITITLTP